MARFVPYAHPSPCTDEESIERARTFRRFMDGRRTVRSFSPRPVPREVVEECLLAAGTAPSGAHRQPWQFVVVEDPDLRRRIREAAEEEERAFYGGRAPDAWLEALAPLGTDEHKPFLQEAPVLIAVFAQRWRPLDDGGREKNYYVQESVGIATGLLIAALHRAGLSTLTHTPSPMGFLADILGRPESERPYLLLVAGHAAPDTQVPVLERKPLTEISTFL